MSITIINSESFTPKMLHVVAAISNPLRWESRVRLYKNFEQHMLDTGVSLTVVDCAHGERGPSLPSVDPRVNHVCVRAETLAWNKENLMNIGIQRLPHDAKYVAWVDADIEFRNKQWATETIHALQHYKVVQPWSYAIDLGPKNEPMVSKGVQVQKSFCHMWRELGHIPKNAGMNGYPYPHPGYAWATTIDQINAWGGLIEASGLGAGDHQMAMSFVGEIKNSIHGQTCEGYQNFIKTWGQRAHASVQGRIGPVEGIIEHFFHGDKSKRRYNERWQILIEHKFDPNTDLKKNRWGVIELAGNKPEMERAFDLYYRERAEDDNCLSS